MKRLIQLTVIALLASLAVSAEDTMAAKPPANPCGACKVESGRYYEKEPIGPNNISNVRGVKSRIVRVNAGGVPDDSVAKAYVSVNFNSGEWIEFGVQRGYAPTPPVIGGGTDYDDCDNTPNDATGDAYPTSRLYAEWIQITPTGGVDHGCLFGQEVVNGEAHDFRLQRCGTGTDWCTYLDGSLAWNTGNWGAFYLNEQGDEVRIASELNCGANEVCHGSGTTWFNRFGGSLNWSVSNETNEQSPSWWNEHWVAGEAAKANTPAGYWVIEAISTTAAWDIYHISA